MMRGGTDIFGCTWEQYDALPVAEREGTTAAGTCRWKWLVFGELGSEFRVTIYEPDEPRPTPGACLAEEGGA